MTTTDDRITQDLAIVGRMSRERPTPFDATLRAVGAVASATAPGLALVVLGRVFVARVARAAAGLGSFACLLTMLGWLAMPRDEGWIEHYGVDRGIGEDFLEAPRWWLGLLVVAVSLAAYVGASGIAARAFERTAARARDPIDAARRLTHRSDAWATAASITGIATFILGFGMLEVVVGDVGLLGLFARAVPIESIRQVMIASLGGAFAATAGGAMLMARTNGDARALRNTGWMLPAGVVLAFVTFFLGARLDAGPLIATITNSVRPSLATRVALTAAGTIAVFLATTGMVLRGRRREEAAIRAADR